MDTSNSFRGLALAALVLVVGVLLLARWKWQNDKRISERLPSTEAQDSIRPRTDGLPSLDPVAGDGLRRSPADLRVRVVDEHGKGIAHATLSWSIIEPSAEHDWPWPSESAWESQTTLATSDPEGTARLVPPTGIDVKPSVIWVSCPGFEVRAIDLGPSLRSALPSEIVLGAAPTVHVTVLDGARRPIASARVMQRLLLDERGRAELSGRRMDAVYALRRVSSTDADGRVELCDLGGRQAVDAVAGGLRSGLWIGTAPEVVELQILPAFTWSAQVESKDEELKLTKSRVSVYSLTGGRRQLVDATILSTGGKIGPRTAPLRTGDEYHFELVDGPVVPVTIRRPPPEPGEHVIVSIPGAKGLPLHIQVQDARHVAVSAAEVSAAWNAGDGWQWVSRFSGIDGIARMDALPAGPLWLVVEKPGFIGHRAELNLSAGFETHSVLLERGFAMSGRVAAEGKPVSDFSIVHRDARYPSDLTTVDFQDRKDGTFVIEGVPAGERSVFAVSLTHPRSSEQRVVVGPDRDVSVEFDLKPGIVGRGSVRDALTQELIAGATAQAWTLEGRVRLREFGPTVRSDSVGRFEVPGLAQGEPSAVEIRAEGYASEFLEVRGGPGPVQDLGIVSMSRPCAVTVQLKVPSGDDVRNWSVSLDGTPDVPPHPFSTTGTVTFQDLLVGGYSVRLERGGELAISRNVLTPPGSHPVVVFDLTRGSALEVAVVPEHDSQELGECWLQVLGYDDSSSNCTVRVQAIPHSKVVRMESVSESRLHLSVLLSSGKTVASRIVSGEERYSQRIVLKVGSDPRRVRIVGPRGEPLPDLTVRIGSPKIGWFDTLSSDSAGIVMIDGMARETLDLSIQRPPQGGGVVRGLTLDGEGAEVVFDGSSALAFQVMDGMEALPGVRVWIRDALGLGATFPSLVTGEDGVARGEGYMAQEFQCEVRQVGVWPSTFLVRATTIESPSIVQVRRIGSALLSSQRGGLALAGVRIQVESEEFATTVDPWISSGAVTASRPDCSTDLHGQVRLDGLPRGPYRWTVTLDDGTQVGGRFEVLPQRRVDVDVLIP